jgi:hypothetical protein
MSASPLYRGAVSFIFPSYIISFLFTMPATPNLFWRWITTPTSNILHFIEPLFIFVDSYTIKWCWNPIRLKCISLLHLICNASYTKIILALNNLPNLKYPLFHCYTFIHIRRQLHQQLALKPNTTETYFSFTSYLQCQLHQNYFGAE